MTELIMCTPKRLPVDQWATAAKTATKINPANAPARGLFPLMMGFTLMPQHIAVLTSKYWGSKGVKLTVQFLDNPDQATRTKILLHMNAWGTKSNVSFTETANAGQVRIARAADGYWSYLGTDILSIPPNQPTMNLQDFTINTPDSEYYRVVRHETGHTLGFPHEHMRKEIVALIDPAKAIAYFGATQGWSSQEVKDQVLTPLNDADLISLPADRISIMCYQLPGSITIDGKPIPGGTNIDEEDYQLAARLYPLNIVNPPNPPPPPSPPPPPPPPPHPTAGYTVDQAIASVDKACAAIIRTNNRSVGAFVRQANGYIDTVVRRDAAAMAEEFVIPILDGGVHESPEPILGQ